MMKPKSWLCYLVLVLTLTACVKRQTLLAASSAAAVSIGPSPTEVIPETRQRSVVFDKPVTSIAFDAASEIQPRPSAAFEWWKVPDDDDPLYADMNHFFSQNYAARSVTLKGADHFLNSLWEITEKAVGVGAIAVGLFASHIIK